MYYSFTCEFVTPKITIFLSTSIVEKGIISGELNKEADELFFHFFVDIAVTGKCFAAFFMSAE